MPKTRIHVNQHVIRRNVNTGERKPVLTVKQGRKNTYCHAVDVLGPSRVVYSPDKPLSCGARVWVETDSDVVIHDSIESCAALTCTPHCRRAKLQE